MITQHTPSPLADELREAIATLEAWKRRALEDRNLDYSLLITASEARVERIAAGGTP